MEGIFKHNRYGRQGKARQAIKAKGLERQVSASSAKNVLALGTFIIAFMGTTRSGVGCVWEQDMGMAKSGDDLMRWQELL